MSEKNGECPCFEKLRRCWRELRHGKPENRTSKADCASNQRKGSLRKSKGWTKWQKRRGKQHRVMPKRGRNCSSLANVG